MGIAIPLLLIFLACLFIWRACDGFEIASEYIGRNLSEGVRGGTINAISSSVPELFTTLIALFVLADKDGFAVGLGTTAGSALFNGMIIPAVCILTVVGAVVLGVRVTTVKVSRKVVLRDGLSLIACEFILILLINGQLLHWWQGLIMMGMYAAYLTYMLVSMQASPDGEHVDDAPHAAHHAHHAHHATEDESGEADEVIGLLGTGFYWLSGGPALNLEDMFIGEKQREQIKAETWNGWPLLLASTSIIALACWALVKACEWLGTGNPEHPSYALLGYELTGLGIPAMFVAVIFASMATSVPDTVMSIRDARDGDYDDAVANALGSNIFDICFALGFPMFIFTLFQGPIEMSEEVARQSGELRLLLLFLTIAGFLVYFLGKTGKTPGGTRYVEMGRAKAFMLLSIYGLFCVYILGRCIELPITDSIVDFLDSLLDMLPSLT